MRASDDSPNHKPTTGWWRSHIRRTVKYFRSSVSGLERVGLASWLSPAQLKVFDGMSTADRRHCLDTVAWLRAHEATDSELLVAAALHDAGKGRHAHLLYRIVYSLGQRYGSWIWRVASLPPHWGEGLARLREHAELSAELAEEAGCSPRTVELIRHQESPIDDAGRLLLAADDAS